MISDFKAYQQDDVKVIQKWVLDNLKKNKEHKVVFLRDFSGDFLGDIFADEYPWGEIDKEEISISRPSLGLSGFKTEKLKLKHETDDYDGETEVYWYWSNES